MSDGKRPRVFESRRSGWNREGYRDVHDRTAVQVHASSDGWKTPPIHIRCSAWSRELYFYFTSILILHIKFPFPQKNFIENIAFYSIAFIPREKKNSWQNTVNQRLIITSRELVRCVSRCTMAVGTVLYANTRQWHRKQQRFISSTMATLKSSSIRTSGLWAKSSCLRALWAVLASSAVRWIFNSKF